MQSDLGRLLVFLHMRNTEELRDSTGGFNPLPRGDPEPPPPHAARRPPLAAPQPSPGRDEPEPHITSRTHLSLYFLPLSTGGNRSHNTALPKQWTSKFSVNHGGNNGRKVLALQRL